MGMYKMLGPAIREYIYIYIYLDAGMEHLEKNDYILGHKYMSAMIKKSC